MQWIVWVRDGGSWRVLACYDTRREAEESARIWRHDGSKASVCERGSKRDRSLRANVCQS